MGIGDAYCELCGNDTEHGAYLTIAFEKDRPMSVRCSDCMKWIESGSLRVEEVDGVLRLREWKFEWIKGDLLPSAEENRKRAGL